ncbi:TonB-dependent receptor [Aquirhabdus parva]|uniref:TonB-dependent receptor n=1 Tax=Aquirhabdus parva TaxID=2283318 RepID=A0A345P4X4_9GAMM|nr:TonB-dependent receptor [Aquirhabdus parva]AXI02333.1 TonB-dependent receptor [Aquirhabdus parva]
MFSNDQTLHKRFQRNLLSSAVMLASLSMGFSALSFAAEGDVPPVSNGTSSQNSNTPVDSDTSQHIESIVVTSRNREELAQNIPVPVSVIGSKQLDRDGIVSVDDLTRKAPGLTATTPNARRTGISIRGIGKASGNDNMEAAVGVIVDNVFLSHVGMSYQDFTDLDRVEVLRGPQGTLLGKNTTMGAINYVSKLPSFKPQGSFEVEGGLNKEALKLKASRSDALIDDVLAYRASVFVDQQQGDLKNISPLGGNVHEKNRFGGRLQFLWKPTENLNIRLNLDEAQSKEYSNTKPFMIDPLTFADGSSRTASNKLTYTSRLSRDYFGGYVPVVGDRSWNEIDVAQLRPLITNNSGESLTIDWDLGDLTFTSITAGRKLHFDANNDSDQTKFDINQGGTLVDHEQFSQEFRLTSAPSKVLDYQVGLYYLHDSTESTSRTLYGQDAGAFYASNSQYSSLKSNKYLLSSSLNQVYSTTLTTPQTDSVAAFGQANWHLNDKATLTFGLRDTNEKKSSDSQKNASFYDGSALVSTGNAAADAIRASQLGTVYGLVHGQDINNNSVSWLLSPSYQLDKDVLLYASASSGQKSGSVQFKSNGTPLNVDPEKSLDFELGVKSLLLDKRLLLNVNLYQTTVKDYQATTSILDSTSSTGYSSVLGNIPEIRARGVEIEGSYAASHDLNLNFSLAYNDAIYSDWSTATCPAEIVSVAVCNNTGKQVVGAPKVTGVVGADYQTHLGFGGLSFHSYINAVARTSQNLESQLSIYGRQAGYTLVDGGLGVVGNYNKNKFEVDLIAKNLFDTKYTTSINGFSNSSPVGYDGIGARRYIGLVFKTKY